MTKQELLNLVHQNVCDSFSFYQSETIEASNSLLNALQPSTVEQGDKLKKALFDYTMSISETICLAMSKTLISANVLNVSEVDD